MTEAKQKSQLDKFKDAARELETDDSEASFDRALKKVAKMPPGKVKEAIGQRPKKRLLEGD